MEYVLPLAMFGLATSVCIGSVFLRREMRAQGERVVAFGSALKAASDKFGPHISRIADRSERLEKVLLELVERADAAMSVSGVDFKAYQKAKRDAAVDQMRDLLSRGDEVAAIHVWRKATSLGMGDALAMIEVLEREMGATEPAQIVCSPAETPQRRPEIRNGAIRTN
jgi:hypothetical protein